MKKIIYFISILSFLIFIPLFATQASLSDSFGSTLNKAANSSGYKIDGSNNITAILSTVISVVLGLLGTIFIALILYGGVTWMLAEGNEQRVEKAGNIIRQAIIGLIVVIAAYAISYFLINTLGGQLNKP